MIEAFFGLKKRPFHSSPVLDRYFPAEGIEHAFQTISRVLDRAEGPAVIFGGPGLGKTLLCLRIAQAFQDQFEVVLLSGSKLGSRRALFQSILFELRMPYRGFTESELRLSLLDRLHDPAGTGSGLLLIVDEAQTLGLKLLEELRLLTNIAVGERPRVRLIQCGTLKLEEFLAHPRMESLQQRIACRCYLKPLHAEEVGRYIDHKIALCSGDPRRVFTEDACRMIHRASDGIPRIIDQLADHSMLLAAKQRQSPVGAILVEQAWTELQQIPAPWTGTKIEDRPESGVEFGSLEDDEPDLELPEANPSASAFDFETETTWDRSPVYDAGSHGVNSPISRSQVSPSEERTPDEPPPLSRLDKALVAVQVQIPNNIPAKILSTGLPTPLSICNQTPVGTDSSVDWSSIQICSSQICSPSFLSESSAAPDRQLSASVSPPSDEDIITEEIPATHDPASSYLMRRGMGPNRVHVVSFASLDRSEDVFQTDDREMIVIDEEVENRRSPSVPTTGPKNLAPTYLQLFSRLRG